MRLRTRERGQEVLRDSAEKETLSVCAQIERLSGLFADKQSICQISSDHCFILSLSSSVEVSSSPLMSCDLI